MNGRSIELFVNDAPVRCDAGATVASALTNAGISAFRASRDGTLRAPLCGMGVCHECRVTIDGVANRRACMIVADNGMRVSTARGGE